MSVRIWSVSLFCVPAGRAAGPPAASFGDNGQLKPQLEARANLPRKLDRKVQRVVPLGQGPYRLTLENGQIGGGRGKPAGLWSSLREQELCRPPSRIGVAGRFHGLEPAFGVTAASC